MTVQPRTHFTTFGTFKTTYFKLQNLTCDKKCIVSFKDLLRLLYYFTFLCKNIVLNMFEMF